MFNIISQIQIRTTLREYLSDSGKAPIYMLYLQGIPRFPTNPNSLDPSANKHQKLLF